MKYYNSKIEYLKMMLGGKCVVCGSTDDLEFDHIDKSTKSFTICTKWSYSLEEVKKEAMKCQLLCKRCHKNKTKAENSSAIHGSLAMYSHQRCRCELCRNIRNAYIKEYKMKRKRSEII